MTDEDRQTLFNLLEFARRYMYNNARAIDIEFGKDMTQVKFMLELDKFFNVL